jgi:hypothetical protein
VLRVMVGVRVPGRCMRGRGGSIGMSEVAFGDGEWLVSITKKIL